MKGTELKEWRKNQEFTQAELVLQLGLKSRQTLISREKSDEDLPRLWELALLALEKVPNCYIADRTNRQDSKEWNQRFLPTKEEERRFKSRIE